MSNDDSDRRLFRDAVSGVAPVAQPRIAPKRSRPAPVPAQSKRDEQAVVRALETGLEDPPDCETGEEIAWLRAGVQRAVLRKLRRGDFSVTCELDLHGHTVASAQAVLSAFLHQARRQDHRCIRIIHGKGLRSPGKTPVLKNKVYGWLRRRDEVLAIATARPQDGGSGAVYVILKRRR